MNYLTGKDYLEVHGASLISNVDIDVVSRLYQPLVGYKATMLYLTLVNTINCNEGELTSHEEMFKIMQILPGDFLLARKSLEACGLLKTYLKIDNDIKYYTYVVYSPKSPKEFFNDVLFKGLLVRYIGEKEATKLAIHYANNIKLDGAKEITANFVDVFHPDLNDACFDAKMPANLKGDRVCEANSQFDFGKFFEHLKIVASINENAFDEKELNEIERLATLYGLDVISTCDIVAQSYNENKEFGSRLDVDGLKDRAIIQAKYSQIAKKNHNNLSYIKISGRTVLADELTLMEQLAPVKFLEKKQDGAPVVSSDLKLLNYLSEYMGLNHGTINALISYCLKTCDNHLTRSYVEKIAATLKRARIDTALDAINFLEKDFKKKKKAVDNQKPLDKVEDNDDFDEEEYDKLLASLEDDK